MRLPELIKTVLGQKTLKDPDTFVDDSNYVFEALLAALDLDQIEAAIKDHSLKGPSYLSAARALRLEAVKRKLQRQEAREAKEAKG